MSVSKPFVFALVCHVIRPDEARQELGVNGTGFAPNSPAVNPITKRRVVIAESCRYALAVMATADLYETSGDWLYDTGLPGKSGIAGGIVAVSPGKGGLGTFAPRLDPAGDSVKGQLVARFLSEELGMNLFVSKPEDQHDSLGLRINKE